MSGERQYSTFYAGQFHFAVDVDHVQEVLQPMSVTPVPLTSDLVDGLVNLRGQIITAIDLRTRLDLPRCDSEGPTVSLIIRTSSGPVSLRADRLGDVTDLVVTADVSYESGEGAARALESLPDTVRGPMRDVVRGIIQLQDSLLLVLDPDLLLTAEVGLQPSEKEP